MMKQKLKSIKGETLVEALAAILIGTLSVALLFSAVVASANMDRNAKAWDEEFKEALNIAEEQLVEVDESVVPAGSKVIVENVDPSITAKAEVEVEFYGGKGVVSYKLP